MDAMTQSINNRINSVHAEYRAWKNRDCSHTQLKKAMNEKRSYLHYCYSMITNLEQLGRDCHSQRSQVAKLDEKISKFLKQKKEEEDTKKNGRRVSFSGVAGSSGDTEGAGKSDVAGASEGGEATGARTVEETKAAARQRAEEEAAAKRTAAEEEAAAKRKAEEKGKADAKRQAEEKEEADAKRQADEKEEADAKRQAEEEAATAQRKAEEEAADAKRQAEEEKEATAAPKEKGGTLWSEADLEKKRQLQCGKQAHITVGHVHSYLDSHHIKWEAALCPNTEREKLQGLAKMLGVKANLKTTALIKQIEKALLPVRQLVAMETSVAATTSTADKDASTSTSTPALASATSPPATGPICPSCEASIAEWDVQERGELWGIGVCVACQEPMHLSGDCVFAVPREDGPRCAAVLADGRCCCLCSCRWCCR